MSIPTLSVAMCNYNHAHYLKESLGAILSQSFRPLEVVVLDDGSTDNSVNLIKEFAQQDPAVRLLQNDRNKGLLFSSIRATAEVRGDYLYCAASDDKVLPGLFEKSMHMLIQYPEAGLCCSDPVYFDERTGLQHKRHLGLSNRPRYFSPQEFEYLIRKKHIDIPTFTCLVKRSVWLENPAIIQQLKWHYDWFAVHAVGFKYGICYIPELLVSMRVVSNSYSANMHRQINKQREVLINMMNILESPTYNDIRPIFKHSCILSIFRFPMLGVLLSKPKYWDYLSFLMILRIIKCQLLGTVSSFLPFWLKRIGYRIFNLDRIEG